MAAPYFVGSIFRVMLGGRIGTGPTWSNTWQFVLETPNTGLTFAQVVVDMEDVVFEIASAVKVYQGDEWTWDVFSVSELDGSTVSGVLALTAPQTGLLADAAILPTQTTAQAAFPTGEARRILKKAFPGMVEAQTVPETGQFTSTFVNNFAGALAFLLDGIEATNGFWQYMHKSDPAQTPALVYPQSVKVSPSPKVQRRRRLA